MRAWLLILVLGAAALISVRVVAIEDCCYGTQCAPPDPNQCTMVATNTAYYCKRTCADDCTQGNGCCQWIHQTCRYIKKYPWSVCPGDSQQNIAVNWWHYKRCRTQDGAEVDCLGTARNRSCADP